MSRQQLIDEPGEAVPEAAQLLAGYFHQDWVLDSRRWEDVVDGFVAESPRSAVMGAAADLRTLLAAGLGEVELAGVLDRLGASVDPAADGLTAAGWLEAVLARLDTRTSG
jgi:CdiI immunity protein